MAEETEKKEHEEKKEAKKVAHIEPIHPGDERVGKSRHLLDTCE